MRRWRRKDVRALALKHILKPLWERRREFAPGAGPSVLGLLPIRPDRIITELLELRLERVPEIIPEGGADLSYEVTGLLDRELRRIVIATSCPMDHQRFTMAHELGHFFLHPSLVYHRDSPRDTPLDGTNQIDVFPLPPEEVEANWFAAEILMPKRLVIDLFIARYRKVISPDEIDEDFAFQLSRGLLSAETLRHKSRRYRSCLIAVNGGVATSGAINSFVDLFAVSVKAMAIRLEQLGLVM